MRQRQNQSQKPTRQTHFTHYFNVNSSTFTFHNIPIRWNSPSLLLILFVCVCTYFCVSLLVRINCICSLRTSVITPCALFNELERFSSCRCHRCYPHVFNQQPTNKSKEMKRKKQNKIIQMQCVFTYGFVSCIFSLVNFYFFFRSWEMMNTVAVAALLPPANYLPFLSPWCVRVRVFLHLIFFRGRLLSNEIFHRLMHVYVDQAIRMMKTKKPVTFWKMFWEEYLVYACECVRVCTRIHIGGAKFFGHTLSFIGLDDLV